MRAISQVRFVDSRSRKIVALSGLADLYLVSRVAFLLRLPPFIDEATYLLWVQEVAQGNFTVCAYDGRWTRYRILLCLRCFL